MVVWWFGSGWYGSILTQTIKPPYYRTTLLTYYQTTNSKPMRYPLLYLCLCLLLCCKTKKEVGTPSEGYDDKVPTIACTTHAIVEDMTGLDGCGLLLRVDNGEKWLPTNLETQEVKLEKNQEVYFGYRPMEDAVSICMAENKIIELTCLQVVGKTGGIKPGKPECVNTSNPLKVEWIRKMYDKHLPQQIIKYPFRKGDWAYLFKTKTSRYLYDCQGYFICEAAKDAKNDCVDTYLQYLRDGKIVFQDEEPGN